MFVVISCGCCFLQSCIAFGVLLPILYSRKCSVTFLKMQFCTATSTAMAIFTLGFLKFLPQVSNKYVEFIIILYFLLCICIRNGILDWCHERNKKKPFYWSLFGQIDVLKWHMIQIKWCATMWMQMKVNKCKSICALCA